MCLGHERQGPARRLAGSSEKKHAAPEGGPVAVAMDHRTVPLRDRRVSQVHAFKSTPLCISPSLSLSLSPRLCVLRVRILDLDLRMFCFCLTVSVYLSTPPPPHTRARP